jgi:parallel beta-helix repeat protein
MNDERSFERLFADRMRAEHGSTQLPEAFYEDFRQRASHQRQRPRWLALIKEPPMRISSTLAVGSPMARVAAIVVATLLLALTVAGAGIAGSRLLAADGTLVVDPNDPGAYPTISDAVAAAVDGDTILVRPGTYLESVAITTDIPLRGDGARGAVVVEFAVDGPTHPWAEDGGLFAYGVFLDGSEARVENLTIRGPAEGGAFVIDGGAPVVEGVDIVLATPTDEWYYKRSAFRIQGGSSPVIRESTWDAYTRISGEDTSGRFEGNTMTAHIIAIGASGAKAVIVGNTFLDGASILFAEFGSSAIVEDNDIDGSLGGYAGADTIIRNNRIREGYQAGPGERGSAIQLTGSGTAIVEGNEILDSQYGIDVTGFGGTPRISGNTIRGSEFAAIVVDNGTAPTIDGNTIEKNATGIEVLGASIPVMTGNTLCENGTDLTVPDGSALTLDGNTVCLT